MQFQLDPQIIQERQISAMISKLQSIEQRDLQVRTGISYTVQNPDKQKVQDLSRIIQQNRATLAQVLANLSIFQQQTCFMDLPQHPIPDPILTGRVGQIQHAVIQQMQIADTLHTGRSYEGYNLSLTKRIIKINDMINDCLRNVADKL